MAEPAESALSAEEQQAYARVLAVFRAQGFDEVTADLLASADVDPADTTRLLRHGCSVELAAHIVL